MPNLSRYLVIGSVIALLAVGLTVGLSDEKEAPKEAPKNPLLGTWELVKFKSDDGEFKDFQKEHRRVKLITDTHWSWVEYSTDGPKEVQGGAGGPYTLKGDNYVETIEFATKEMADFLDKSLAFKIRIDGDKCVVTGALPNGLGLEEIWQRVKAPLPPKAP